MVEASNSVQKNAITAKKLILSAYSHLNELNNPKKIPSKSKMDSNSSYSFTNTNINSSFLSTSSSSSQKSMMFDESNYYLKNVRIYNALSYKNEILYRFIKRLKRYFSNLIKSMDFLYNLDELNTFNSTPVIYSIHDADQSKDKTESQDQNKNLGENLNKGKGKEKDISNNDIFSKFYNNNIKTIRTKNDPNDHDYNDSIKYLSQSNHVHANVNESFFSSSPPFVFLSPISPKKINVVKSMVKQQQRSQQKIFPDPFIFDLESESIMNNANPPETEITQPINEKDSREKHLSTLNVSSSYINPLISSDGTTSNNKGKYPEGEDNEEMKEREKKEKYIKTIREIYDKLNNYSPLLNTIDTSLQSDRSYIDSILSLCLM
eukprot:jgi/Orpsp1_1/1176567/evm.model.c7180000058113.1